MLYYAIYEGIRKAFGIHLKKLRKQKKLTGNISSHNLRLLERFKALEGFDKRDQETVIKLIDAMIVKQKVKGALRVAM